MPQEQVKVYRRRKVKKARDVGCGGGGGGGIDVLPDEAPQHVISFLPAAGAGGRADLCARASLAPPLEVEVPCLPCA